MTTNQSLLSVTAAAAFLGVHPTTIKQWAKNGKVKAVKIGSRGDWRFPKDELVKLLKGEHTSIEDTNYLAALTEIIVDAVISTDKENKVVSWNKGAEKLYGWKAAEVIGKPTGFLKTEYINEYETSQTVYKQFIEQGYWKGEVVQQRKDGTKIFILASVSAMKDAEGNFLGGVAVNRDISESKKIGEALHQSEERLRATFEQAAVGMAHVGFDGTWLMVNQRLCDIVGYSKSELMKRTFQDITHPDDLEADLHLARKLYEGKITNYSMEKRYIRKDASIVWVNLTASIVNDNKGFPLYYISVIEDITERKNIEEKNRYHAHLLESLSEGVFSTDTTTKILSWNKAAEDIFKISEKEAVGKKLTSLVNVEFIDTTREKAVQLLMKSGSWKGEVVYEILKTGKRLTLLSTGSVVHDDAGKSIGFVTTVIDITERKKAQAHKDFLEKVSSVLGTSIDYRTTLNNIANLIIPELADYCRLVVVNENKQIEEIVVKHADPKKLPLVEELYHEYMNNSNNTHGVGNLLLTGKAEMMEVTPTVLQSVTNEKVVKLVKKLGVTSYMGVPMRLGDKIVGFITFSSTKKERVYTKSDLELAEELGRRAAFAVSNARFYLQAQESEKRFKLLADSSPVLMWVNGLEGAEFVNKAYLDFLDVRPTDVTNYDWAAFIHPDDRNAYVQSYLDALANRTTFESHFRFKRNDGEYRWMKSIGIPRYSINGTFEGYLGSTFDITDVKNAIVIRDEFISVASHELKTPITSLKMYTHLLQNQLERLDGAVSTRSLDKMNNQINRLHGLIQDLLNVSKVQSGKLEFNKTEFDLNELVSDVVESMQQVEKHHKIIVEGTIQKKVWGDKDRIEQVLTNLITNALKFSPNANKIVVRLNNKKEAAHVIVQDFGIGIEKEQKERIFEKFYRASSADEKTFPGLGLGLYISYQIIQRHGGTMSVESARGKGSEFSFTLPNHA